MVLAERWPDEDDGHGPVAPPSHLRAPDQHAVVGVRDIADTLLTPPGSLGALDRAVDRVLTLGHADVPSAAWSLLALTIPSAPTGFRPTIRASPVTV
ncbi:MAG: hypothetical protein LC749_17840 [Actinobacteria bacterium]|nr:hypothetical protein [Actinomycetota bacterium]